MTLVGKKRMRNSLFGKFVVRFYSKLPLRDRLLGFAVWLEGGQFYSLSLRGVLRRYRGVDLGNYSYGSLARPGMADRGTTIGSYVSIGPGVRRFGAAHPLNALCMHPFWYNPALGYVDGSEDVERSGCYIGDGVWIGANAIILPGCKRIGVGAVVGAGAIVTRDVPDFAVVLGNPARQVRTRLDAHQREWLLTSGHWQLDPIRAQSRLREQQQLLDLDDLTP